MRRFYYNYLDWFRSLSIHKRITIKEIAILLFGVSWSDLAKILTYSERVEMVYRKMKCEGLLW
jgi:hypothetical protein